MVRAFVWPTSEVLWRVHNDDIDLDDPNFDDETVVTVDEETLERWLKVMEEFEDVQLELQEYAQAKIALWNKSHPQK